MSSLNKNTVKKSDKLKITTGTKLGKGLASLIQDNSFLEKENLKTSQQEVQDNKEGKIYLIEVSQIVPNTKQPRKIFKEKEIEELANSIKENGLIQPIIVTKTKEGKFELIAGERRLRATKLLKNTHISALIKRVTEKEKSLLSIVENVQRSDLNCIEEALAYYQLLTEYHLTQEEVALRVGKDRSVVANFLRLLKLPKEVIGLLQSEKLSFGHGKVLAGLKEAETILLFANKTIENNFSVRLLEQEIQDFLQKKSSQGPHNDNKNKEGLRLADLRQLESLRQEMQKKTGWDIKIGANSSKKDKGKIIINYNDKDEFNHIFDFLMK